MKKLNGYVLKVSTKLSRCKDGKNASKKLLELIWVDTDKSVDSAHKKIRSRLCQGIQDKKAKQYLKSLTCFSVVLGIATT